MSKLKVKEPKKYQNLLISKPVIESLEVEKIRTGKSKSVIVEEAIVLALGELAND
jgi:hypothetical protein